MNGSAPTVASWWDGLFNPIVQVENAGVPMPQEPILNLVGFTVQDDPLNGRTTVTAGSPAGGVLVYGGVITTAAYAAPANTTHGGDTTSNPVAFSTPSGPSAGDGCVFELFDAGRKVETNGMSVTDTVNGYLIENPIDLELYATISWGPGSGGGANPNLPKGKYARWMRVTTTGPSGKTFWQAVSA